MSARAAELEIGLRADASGAVRAELRFAPSEGEADVRKEVMLPALDRATLLALEGDARALGDALSEWLLRGALRPSLEAAFAASASAPLRLRLVVAAASGELHSVRWEALRSLDGSSPLLTGERVMFSRYLASSDWRPVRLRARGDLRALVVVANPSDLASYQLAPVDVSAELARTRAALEGLAMDALAAPGQATLEGIVRSLQGGTDVLYVVAHGALRDGEPVLWLEDEQGRTSVTRGADLAERLAELQDPPRLVVLASCQSAGTGSGSSTREGSALAALGPRLAAAGVPAVLSMQGDVTMGTVAELMPAFFAELQRDGVVDRALAVARGRVRDRPDWWMPVLHMRLRSGRLWNAPGFDEAGGRLEKWPALVRHLEAGRCTPVLGPELSSGLFGNDDDLARGWAQRFGYPLGSSASAGLAGVAQYLAVDQDYRFPREELLVSLRERMLAMHGHRIPKERHGAPLAELVIQLGRELRAAHPLEPHRVLARLPLPVYVTAAPDSQLADALREAGRTPRVECCKWNPDIENLPSIYDEDPKFRPSVDEPLVFHLFGVLEAPESLVLTEDDHLDFLIGLSRQEDLVPGVVRRALADSALLFLGFLLEDWAFRVLHRTLMSQEGRKRRGRYAHVAAQLDLDGGRCEEPDRARRYLERYFQDADISIYWGSVSDFASELGGRLGLEATKAAGTPVVPSPPPVPQAVPTPAPSSRSTRRMLHCLGLDGESGKPLLPSMTADELMARAQQSRPGEGETREMKRWLQLRGESHYGPAAGVDAEDLASAGWGVVFGPGTDSAVREALGPLLALRKEQAGRLYREYELQAGETKSAFLARFGAGFGPADPETVPYYLMLVGDPVAIPFRFQYELDVQRAVGRIAFDAPQDYANHARTVVCAERGELRRPRRVTLFGPDGRKGDSVDEATSGSCEQLVKPLAAALVKVPGWSVGAATGSEATKARLLSLFGKGGEDESALVFTATHGFGGVPKLAGALVTQDWDPSSPCVPPQAMVAAEDIADDAAPAGRISMHVGCFTAGMPEWRSFQAAQGGEPMRWTDKPFVAALMRRLLSHPGGGLLAAVGHVDFAWAYSFVEQAGSGPLRQIQCFRSTMEELLAGRRLGHAMEHMNQRHAELSVALAGMLEDERAGKVLDEEAKVELCVTWTTNNDARNYLALGDPAVRLPASD